MSMRFFRRIMLSGGASPINIDEIPNTQKLYYTATSQVTPSANSLGSPISLNKWDAATGNGVIVCREDITSIGQNAFLSCNTLISVTIPDSVTSIGGAAFSGCDNLHRITIPNSVTSIGYEAFSHCTGELIIDSKIVETDYTSASNFPIYSSWLKKAKFTKLTIGNTITKIGYQVFRNFQSLTSVTIGDNVTFISSRAFLDCKGLVNLTIPDNVTILETYAFSGCNNLTDVVIGNGVTEIQSYAFYYCTMLTNIVIGESVTLINHYAFEGCTSLTSVFCKPQTPPVLRDSTLKGTTSLQYIYVPMESVDAYKAATNWSEYADSIVGYDFNQATE